MIRVTNHNDFDLADRYNGIDYTFPAGGASEVPLEAARHIFGLGQADKIQTLTRLGWMMHSVADLEPATQKLGRFTFEQIEETTLEAPAPMPMSVALRPPANAAGEAEETAAAQAPLAPEALDQPPLAARKSLLTKLGAFVASS